MTAKPIKTLELHYSMTRFFNDFVNAMRGKFTSGLPSERGSARDLTIVEVAKNGCKRTHSDQNEIYSTFPPLCTY